MNSEHKPHGAGKSSFGLIDSDALLKNLELTASTVFLDLGCGRGDYSVAIAKSLGPGAIVYSIDAWQEGLDELNNRAAAENISTIVTARANLNKEIPVSDGIADICLMATVLHDLLRDSSGETVMSEIVRVLKPAGRLCIVEFKKRDDGPGPPLHVRISPEETEKTILPFGFVRDRILDIGPYNYLFTAHLLTPVHT